MAAADDAGDAAEELSNVFERGERLEKGEQEGAGVIARFIGKDGVRLWRGVQDCVRMHYGAERMREVRKSIFRLAWRASALYARGKLKADDVAHINDPLMDTMESLFNTATAESRTHATNVFPLSTKIARLHDALLEVLRRFISESVMRPELALSLTNTFIGVGNESFLNPVMNDEAFTEPRARLADATARLLHRFRHPNFLAGVPSERRCRVQSCFYPRTYGGLCVDHGLERHRRMLERPTLRDALGDARRVSAFARWVQGAHPDSMRLFALWRSCLAYRTTTSPSLRLVKARTLLEKHLGPDADGRDGMASSRAGEGAPVGGGKRLARFSSASASLTWMPAEAVAAVRKRVVEASEWEHAGEHELHAAAARYAVGEDGGSDAGAAKGQPVTCPADLLQPIESEAFDRLDVLFQREYVDSKGYADTMGAISAAITTPRSSRGIRRRDPSEASEAAWAASASSGGGRLG